MAAGQSPLGEGGREGARGSSFPFRFLSKIIIGFTNRSPAISGVFRIVPDSGCVWYDFRFIMNQKRFSFF
jgi:hypothetical protein